MNCKKCGSENVNIQQVTDVKTKRHGVLYKLYWYTIGWLVSLVTWVCFFVFRLFIRIIRGNRSKVISTQRTMAVCQNCGKSWQVK